MGSGCGSHSLLTHLEWRCRRLRVVDVSPPVRFVLVCAECGVAGDGGMRGWRAYRADDLEDDEDVPEVLIFCRDCAEREFG
jgi:hypothetical protein